MLLGSFLGIGPRGCILRSAVGLPCPVCGMSHSVRRLSGGHLLDAVAKDPLAVLALTLVALICSLSIAMVALPSQQVGTHRNWPLRLLVAALGFVVIRWVAMLTLGWPKIT